VQLRNHPPAFKTWQQQECCIPEVSAEFVAAMENVLDLYEEPYDPLRPIVCFDESPKQLIAEVRQPIAPAPGSPARYDTEYERQGRGDEFHMDYTLTRPPFFRPVG
jgi:hypothetical protein